ncbi:c-type cytochrome biogenesis protein CcmI [Thiocapsa roseopersicina]|uniref:Cytochrome c-type biogenesis protein CcmH n=1 Tax=Thiocapsa roseopersicina TaxID=1058 RepID=A0A1H2T180_THIRO|nr:c-type cytochrome biogenesis protein CcmI [Thiocapsa roseopersicina]SDW37024.1 cytochrome c-type biogenesis protein CcmH [Thiocapsa roseopersicina]
MIIFWILTAGLMGLALFFVALPLLQPEKATEAPEQDELNLTVFKQRLQELDADLAGGFLEQDQYAAARRDLERDLLRDIPGELAASERRGASGGRWMAIVLAVAVPTAAVLVYNEVGHREIIKRIEGVALSGETQQPLVGPDGEELPPLEVLVERLAERLAEDPNNVDGWLMIGRTYFTMRRPEQALEAVSRAYALAPERPDVMLAYAEALAANSNNSLEGEPAALIEQVLKADPDNVSARWLSGMLYYQRGQFTAAATAWQRILDEMDPASEDAADMREMITEAQTRAGAPSNAAAAPSVPAAAEPTEPAAAQRAQAESPAAPAPTAGASVTADVSLDQAISAGAAPDDIVFIFARAVAGPPMPLAVQRVQVKDLPTRVTLDDSMAMMPEMSLSSFPQVMIGARVAKSGQATPQPGDLEGESGPIDSAGKTQVAVVIDRIRP